jgi:hypothetical protein
MKVMAMTASYQLGTRSAVELRRDIQDFLVESRHNSGVQASAARAGITVDQLDELGRSKAYDIREEGAGLDHTAVTLIVAFAPAVNHVAMTVWDDILLPWIRRRYGDDAVGPRKT